MQNRKRSYSCVGDYIMSINPES